MNLLKFHLKCLLDDQCQEMLLVTVILAFILAAYSRDCVWLKNEEGAGKLTSLMKSPSGPGQFHFNREKKQAKYIEINLFDSLGASSNNLTMIINIGHYVDESYWINIDNLYLSVLFVSSKDVESANQTKYLSYSLKANISFHLKSMLLVFTNEGNFILNLSLSGDQETQNSPQVLSLEPNKQKQGKLGSYLLQRQQTKLLYSLISVLIMASDIYFLQHYGKLQTSFRLSRTASSLYLFSEAIYYIEIFKAPLLSKFQNILIFAIFMLVVFGKILIFVGKIINSNKNPGPREIMQDIIIMIIGLTFSYSLYFLALVYCIIRDTSSAQIKYTSDQRWLAHWRTIAIILYMPAFKLIYNIPNGFPFDSAIFWWSYLFMLAYLSSIWEINYRGGVKICIHNAKQALSAQLGVYRNIFKNREVKNEKTSKMAEENSQFEIDHRKGKKIQMKQKSK